MSNKPTKEMTEEEVNARLNEALNDPNLLFELYSRDVSKYTQEELFEFYKAAYIATKLKLFGEL